MNHPDMNAPFDDAYSSLTRLQAGMGLQRMRLTDIASPFPRPEALEATAQESGGATRYLPEGYNRPVAVIFDWVGELSLDAKALLYQKPSTALPADAR